VSTSLHLYLLAPPRWVPAPLPPSPVSLVRGCAPPITVVLTWFEEVEAAGCRRDGGDPLLPLLAHTPRLA